MNEDRPQSIEAGAEPGYEPPAVLWEEPYEDVIQAQVVCAQQSGNPACSTGIYI